MGPKCHFAHGKEEIRKPSDALPPDTPYINEPKGGLGIGPNGKGLRFREKGKSSVKKDQAVIENIQMMLMNDASVQNQVTLQQLSFIMQSLEIMHKANPTITNKLRVARELLSVPNLNTVAELVQGKGSFQ